MQDSEIENKNSQAVGLTLLWHNASYWQRLWPGGSNLTRLHAAVKEKSAVGEIAYVNLTLLVFGIVGTLK